VNKKHHCPSNRQTGCRGAGGMFDIMPKKREKAKRKASKRDLQSCPTRGGDGGQRSKGGKGGQLGWKGRWFPRGTQHGGDKKPRSKGAKDEAR